MINQQIHELVRYYRYSEFFILRLAALYVYSVFVVHSTARA